MRWLVDIVVAGRKVQVVVVVREFEAVEVCRDRFRWDLRWVFIMGLSVEIFCCIFRLTPVEGYLQLFFIVSFKAERINKTLLLHNSDITTTKSNSKKYVTRPILLERSGPYIPVLSVVCS